MPRCLALTLFSKEARSLPYWAAMRTMFGFTIDNNLKKVVRPSVAAVAASVWSGLQVNKLADSCVYV
jgi:hypothetical protein